MVFDEGGKAGKLPKSAVGSTKRNPLGQRGRGFIFSTRNGYQRNEYSSLFPSTVLNWDGNRQRVIEFSGHLNCRGGDFNKYYRTRGGGGGRASEVLILQLLMMTILSLMSIFQLDLFYVRSRPEQCGGLFHLLYYATWTVVNSTHQLRQSDSISNSPCAATHVALRLCVNGRVNDEESEVVV